MDKLAQQLLKLKEEFARQRTKRDEAKGRLDGLQAQLKERFNCESTAEAEEYYKELAQEIKSLLESTETTIAELKKILDGNKSS